MEPRHSPTDKYLTNVPSSPVAEESSNSPFLRPFPSPLSLSSQLASSSISPRNAASLEFRGTIRGEQCTRRRPERKTEAEGKRKARKMASIRHHCPFNGSLVHLAEADTCAVLAFRHFFSVYPARGGMTNNVSRARSRPSGVNDTRGRKLEFSLLPLARKVGRE